MCISWGEIGGEKYFLALKKGLRKFLKPFDILWRRLPDLNRRITALQAVALPLGQAAFLERETGFEPATSTLARSHSTTELFPQQTKEIYIDEQLFCQPLI
jgi:hypothetical protein